MSLVKWVLIGLLLLPLAEIAAFLLVAGLIGWFWAFALFIATSVLGVILLKRTGRGDLDRLLREFGRDTRGAPHPESPGVATMVAGILLVFPGFITDAVGAALLVPAIRRWAAAAVAKLVRKRRRRPHDDRMIDLEPGEWHQISDQRQDRRRTRKGGK
jgi:UPF0716 protein FxsA